MRIYFAALLILLAQFLPNLLAQVQDSASLQPLPFKSRIETFSPDGKQIVALAAPKNRVIAGMWSLSQENITTEITDAYRYGEWIITFGWAGSFNGIVTVIGAATGNEKLELLVNERSRFITPNGALIYEHWLVKGAYEPDDSVWMLDLSRPLPHFKLDLGGGTVADEAGLRIYPKKQDSTVKHRIDQMLVSRNSQDVFLVDRSIGKDKPAEVCFVRLGASNLNRAAAKRACVNEKLFTGYFSNEIQSASLTWNSAGALIYSVLRAGKPGEIKDFIIDPVTLVASEAVPPKPPV